MGHRAGRPQRWVVIAGWGNSAQAFPLPGRVAIQSTSILVRVPDNATHRIEVGRSEARVEVAPDQVTWHLSEAKATEILATLESMQRSSDPRHQYVDIDDPCDTLLISLSEYV